MLNIIELLSSKNRAYLHMMDYTSKRPLDINIETISFCPMKCKFCCNRIYNREYTLMSNEMFEHVVDDYVRNVGGGTIGIGSMQSDFLSDPLLLDRIHILKKYKEKLWIHSTTPIVSAIKYTDDQLLEIVSCFDYLVVSVLGHDDESYYNLGGVHAYDIMMSQLLRINKIIIDHKLNIKIDVAFRTYDRKKLIKSMTYKKLLKYFDNGGIIDSFFSWFGSIREDDLPEGAKLYILNNRNKTEDCVVPYATLAVQSNGNVISCGCIDWLEKNVIGNVKDNSLLEIWKSDKAVQSRKAFSNGKEKPSICVECGLYTSVNVFKNKKFTKYESKDGLYYYIK